MAQEHSLVTGFYHIWMPRTFGTRWTPPSHFDLLFMQPMHSLITLAYRFFNSLHKPRKKDVQFTVKVVCLSDTHSRRLDDVPEGDLLIHAGDLTKFGTPLELEAQFRWLSTLPHTFKVLRPSPRDDTADEHKGRHQR
jgi:hypothetical protein